MDRDKYNKCMAAGLHGKTLAGEERRKEFCVLAKTCAGKAKTREEAEQICSQPREPKPRRHKERGEKSAKSCDKEVLELAHCMVEHIDMDQASNINSVEMAMANAMGACKCG